MKRILLLLITLCTFATAGFASDKGLVVVLSGGGSKGYAHIGALKALEEAGIRPEAIVGTSIGAMVGGLYSAGYDAKQLEQIALRLNLQALITDEPDQSLSKPSSGQTSPKGESRFELQLNKHWRPVGPLGFFAGNRLVKFLGDLTKSVTTDDFKKLPTPFVAVATNLETGEKCELTSGNLASAIRASISLPGVFDPWEYDGKIMVDGGLVSNLPVETAKKLFPGHPVLAIDLSSTPVARDELTGLIPVFNQSITIMTRSNVLEERKLADVVLPLDVKEYPILGNVPVKELIDLGYDAAKKMMDQIVAVAEPFEYTKQERVLKPTVTAVELQGFGEKLDKKFTKQLTKRWVGKPYDQSSLSRAVSRLRQRGDVRSVDTSLEEQEGGAKVKLIVTKYPPHRVGFEAHANTLARRGWLIFTDHSNNIFTEGDAVSAKFYLGKNWGMLADYYGADLTENPWQVSARIGRFSLRPQKTPYYDGDNTEWSRYGLTLSKTFSMGRNSSLSLGFDSYYVRLDASKWNETGREVGDFWSFSPILHYQLSWQNDWVEPVSGLGFDVALRYPLGGNKLVGSAVLHGATRVGADHLLEVTGGYSRGDLRLSPYWGAYLGLRGELYSLMDRPLLGDSFAWGRIAFSHTIQEGLLGRSKLQLFLGGGWLYDERGEQIAKPWEAGILITAPKKLLNAQAFAVYSDGGRDRWKFGLLIGQPDMRLFLPY